MSQKVYSMISALLFLALALAHLSRLIVGWDLVFAGWAVPKSLSLVGLAVTGVLAIWGFRLASRAGTRRKYSV